MLGYDYTEAKEIGDKASGLSATEFRLNITDYRCNCILDIMNDRDENSRVDLH